MKSYSISGTSALLLACGMAHFTALFAKPNLVLQHSNNKQFKIWQMHGSVQVDSLNFNPNHVETTLSATFRIGATGDFNYDGVADLVFQSSSDDLAVWYMGTDTISRVGSSWLSPSNIGAPGWTLIGSGDFDSDGKGDLVFQRSSDNALAVWLMDGPVQKSAPYFAQSPSGSLLLRAVGDVNRDGKPDLIFQNTAGEMTVWCMDGINRISTININPLNPGSGWVIKGAGDFNHDGWLDLAFQHSTTRDVAVWYLGVNGTTHLGDTFFKPTTLENNYDIVAVDDLDTDMPRRSPGNLTPIIQTTDLFNPHADLDDHFDLATAYGLAKRGFLDVKLVVTDYLDSGHPQDTAAIELMDTITSKSPATPNLQGSSTPYDYNVLQSTPGVSSIISTLQNSSSAVAIQVLGSAREVALALDYAATYDPGLFAAKCRGIYLNAGNWQEQNSPFSNYGAGSGAREYNVNLDPNAYARIFMSPHDCPVYWMPCWKTVGNGARPFSTYFKIKTYLTLGQTSERIMNDFFAQKFVDSPANANQWWSLFSNGYEKELWCLAGFIDAADLGLTSWGELVPKNANPAPVFKFVPAQITCTSGGDFQWHELEQELPDGNKQYVFKVLVDDLTYTRTMTKALSKIIVALDPPVLP
jgi:hypothetical protein